jgi:hypothetical protein
MELRGKCYSLGDAVRDREKIPALGGRYSDARSVCENWGFPCSSVTDISREPDVGFLSAAFKLY